MKTLNKILLSATLGLGLVASAQAHIVGLGWTDLGGGLIKFDALHWHGAQTPASVAADFMTIDGVDYNFTSVTNNTATMTGLTNALTNVSYSSYDPFTHVLTATAGPGSANDGGSVDDWMHVIVSLSGGSHTLTAPFGSGGLTSWELAGSITTVTFSVPDSGSTLALLGLGLLGLARFARVSRKA